MFFSVIFFIDLSQTKKPLASMATVPCLQGIPVLAVPQLYRGKIQYLLPISLLNPKETDLAMTVEPMDGYYIGNTCLNLEMAYGNARLLAKPTAPWLSMMVE